MSPFRLPHILLCGLATLGLLISPVSAQGWNASSPEAQGGAKNEPKCLKVFGQPAWNKWLNEDVVYIITDEERAVCAKLQTNEQREKFIEDFWQRRNPNPTPEANPFKEEHYRRFAYANEHFAADVPGWKTDRGRIYIIYGPPDEREQHRANANPHLPPVASPNRRYRNEVWRYNFIQGLGRNAFFDFVDKCDCGEFQLIHDPTKKPRSKGENQRLVPVRHLTIRLGVVALSLHPRTQPGRGDRICGHLCLRQIPPDA